MKYYVVADVHGFYKPLVAALGEQGYFDDPAPHQLVICGDLFDRGTEAEQLQEFVRDLLKRGEVILIRGNHEDLMVDLTEHLEHYLSPLIQYTHHARNGTLDTLLQLTHMDLKEVFADPAEAQRRMRATPFYREFLPAMRNYFETASHVFVHGWIPVRPTGEVRPFVPADYADWREREEEAWHKARWSNGMLMAHYGAILEGKTIVCGHYHASYGHAVFEGKGEEFSADADFTPYYGRGIVAIDACTSYSGFVNCIAIED